MQYITFRLQFLWLGSNDNVYSEGTRVTPRHRVCTHSVFHVPESPKAPEHSGPIRFSSGRYVWLSLLRLSLKSYKLSIDPIQIFHMLMLFLENENRLRGYGMTTLATIFSMGFLINEDGQNALTNKRFLFVPIFFTFLV